MNQPPSPQPPTPQGYRRARQDEVTAEMATSAKVALASPIGTLLAHDGWAIQLEHHYHEPGGAAHPYGWHKGSTIYIREQTMNYHAGIDISAWQSNGLVPWAQVAQRCQFVVCRATYGTTRDKRVIEHVQRVRDLGLKPGLYHFFRASLPIQDQLDAFGAAADAVQLSPGDLIPALDLEDDTAARPLQASWTDSAGELAESLAGLWGDCLVYLTARDWVRLGKPTWVLRRPLWAVHWTSAPQPATPGDMPWRLWQFSVGPFNPDLRQRDTQNSHALDHDYALDPLPLIPESPAEPVATIDPRSIPWITGRGDDWMEDFRHNRDELMREDT